MRSFVLAGAVATRFGEAAIGAHQIAFQLFVFLALVLDSVAIAGQIIVGRELGAGRTERAYAAGARMIWLSVAAGGVFALAMLALAGVLPRIFTSDAAVLDETALLWPLFALMQPLNGGSLRARRDPHRRRRRAVPRALDGRSPFSSARDCCSSSLAGDWGIRGVWAASSPLILVRLRGDAGALPRGRGSWPAGP